MKKAISVLILIALSLSLATSCNFGSRKAKSVIGNSLLTYYHTIYLYEFEDAVIPMALSPQYNLSSHPCQRCGG